MALHIIDAMLVIIGVFVGMVSAIVLWGVIDADSRWVGLVLISSIFALSIRVIICMLEYWWAWIE